MKWKPSQAVKRNIERFPQDFMFQLTKEEYQTLRSQIVTLESKGKGQYSKYLPYAFTEHGVTMLASVLRSERAIKMNIAIVRAFISLKKSVIEYSELLEEIKELKQKTDSHDGQLNQIYDAIENLLDKKVEQENWDKRQRIGFKK
jgi:phage regulator Rha-like protein